MNGDPRASMTGIPRASTNEVLRSKNRKRDEAIRKKVEQELTKRTNKKRTSGPLRRNSKGTVSSLKPNPAVVIYSTAKIIQAAQLMAAKRTDAVLAVNELGDLVGILTDKDIAFRVVAEGLDVRMTSVDEVMTKDPIAVFDKGNRNEALNIMISRRFRHLPVLCEDEEEGTSVVGLLDITKCVFERLDDLERKVLEDQSIISAMEVLERRGTVNSDRVDHLRIEHECPDIQAVLKKGEHPGDFPSISVRGSVREAARAMKLYHSTAVLVLGTPDGDDKVGGIFTTKDIVLRVIAASLDPNTTSVIRTMTPHPDFVSPNASILEALKKLHVGHFLHLPVIDNTTPVGLIDVMTLTIAMLTYLVNKAGAPADQEGPMWNTFWNSTFAATETEPDMVSQHSETRTGMSSSQVYYRERAPTQHTMSPEPVMSEHAIPITPVRFDGTFTFKLRDMTLNNGKVYRFNSPSNSILAFYERVISKTGYSTGFSESDPTDLDIVTPQGISARLCYLDDEGDIVSIESDKDLQEAVQLATSLNQTRLLVYLGDPPSPQQVAMTSSVAPSVRSVSPNMMVVAQPPQPEGIAKLFEQLKDAPLPVNVALSAGIVVVAYYLMKRMS